VNRIDDDVTWMKDGCNLRHVPLLTNPAYMPVGVVDRDPPHRTTETAMIPALGRGLYVIPV